MKKAFLSAAAVLSASFVLQSEFNPASAQSVNSAPDPNAKICQVITATGSRLGGKKICATRAEWEEKRRADREATEKAQTQLCVINPMTGKCGN